MGIGAGVEVGSGIDATRCGCPCMGLSYVVYNTILPSKLAGSDTTVAIVGTGGNKTNQLNIMKNHELKKLMKKEIEVLIVCFV